MLVDGSVDILHQGTQGFGFGLSATEVKRFQTFMTPATCTGMTDLWLKLRRVAGTEVSSPIVDVYATSNGLPVGNSLKRSFGTSGIGKTFQLAWCPLGLSGLAPSTLYAVVLSAETYPDASLNPRFEWAVAPAFEGLPFGKWDGHSWVNESALGNAFLQVGVVDADNTIDILHSSTNGLTFGQTTDQIKRFQTFIAKGSMPVVGVELKLRRMGSGSHGDVVVELFQTSGHKPTGVALAEAAISRDAIRGEWTEVAAPLCLPRLVGYNEYAIVLSQRSSGGGTYEWASGPSSKALAFGKWNGSSWIDESGLGDGWLRIRTMPPRVSTLDVVPTNVHGNGFGNSVDEIKRYQTFSLATSATVIGADVQIRRFGGTVGQSAVSAQLHRTSGNRPSGTPLASAVIRADQVGMDWATVHLPLKSSALQPGTYALVLGQTTPAAPHYEWAVAPFSPANQFGKWNGSGWIEESGLGDGVTRVWTTSPDLDVNVTHAATSGFGFGNAVDELRRFQTFVTPALPEADAFDLNGIALKVRKAFGSDQSDLVVQLFATSNSRPVGFAKATAIVPAADIGADWTVLNVPLFYATDWFGHSIQPGTRYAIVLTQRVAQGARYEWSTGPVAGGLAFGKWNGTSWVDESSLGCGWLKVSLIHRVGPN